MFLGTQSPRRHLVAETPCHKQVAHLLKKSEEQQHRRHSLATAVPSGIIEESPEKAMRKFDVFVVINLDCDNRYHWFRCFVCAYLFWV